MARKTRKDKEIARLRREIEALRAQIRRQTSDIGGQKSDIRTQTLKVRKQESREVGEGEDPETFDISYLKRDLLKTFALATLAFALLFALYLTEPQWPQIADSLRLAANKLRLPF